jgi:hypothetical protein
MRQIGLRRPASAGQSKSSVDVQRALASRYRFMVFSNTARVCGPCGVCSPVAYSALVE